MKPKRTQKQEFYAAHETLAACHNTMLVLLFGPNPITDDELRRLIAQHPERYGRFTRYLGTRKQA